MRSNYKQQWVDYAKGIGIVMVVFKHCLIGLQRSGGSENPEVLNFIHFVGINFRMPLFFLVSGIFFAVSMQRSSFLTNLERKFQTIFYPYLVWGTIQIGLQVLFHSYTNSDRKFSDILFLILDPRQVDQFWYLATLFHVNILFSIFYQVKQMDQKKLFVLGIILFALAQTSWLSSISILHDICFYFVFFSAGYMLSEKMRDPVFQQDMLKSQLWLPTLFLFVISIYFDRYQPPESSLILLLWRTVNTVTGIFLAFLLSLKLAEDNLFRVLKVVGRHSLYIYLLHVIVAAFLRALLVRVFKITDIYVLFGVMTVLAVMLPILFYQFCEKMNLLWLFNGHWIRKKNFKPIIKENEVAKISEVGGA